MNTEPMPPAEFAEKHRKLEEDVRALNLGALACLLQARRLMQKFADDLQLEIAKCQSRETLNEKFKTPENPA